MEFKNQGGTNASDSSNCFVFIYLHTVVLIVNPVILNKQERFFSMQSLWSWSSKWLHWSVMLFYGLKSVILVQRRFTLICSKAPPQINKIHRWYKQFTNIGSVKKLTRASRPPVSGEPVENIRLRLIRLKYCFPQIDEFNIVNRLYF